MENKKKFITIMLASSLILGAGATLITHEGIKAAAVKENTDATSGRIVWVNGYGPVKTEGGTVIDFTRDGGAGTYVYNMVSPIQKIKSFRLNIDSNSLDKNFITFTYYYADFYGGFDYTTETLQSNESFITKNFDPLHEPCKFDVAINSKKEILSNILIDYECESGNKNNYNLTPIQEDAIYMYGYIKGENFEHYDYSVPQSGVILKPTSQQGDKVVIKNHQFWKNESFNLAYGIHGNIIINVNSKSFDFVHLITDRTTGGVAVINDFVGDIVIDLAKMTYDVEFTDIDTVTDEYYQVGGKSGVTFWDVGQGFAACPCGVQEYTTRPVYYKEDGCAQIMVMVNYHEMGGKYHDIRSGVEDVKAGWNYFTFETVEIGTQRFKLNVHHSDTFPTVSKIYYGKHNFNQDIVK